MAVDLYREIHKGLRLALFTVTEQAGRADVGNDAELTALQERVKTTVWMLREHARHEDNHVQPLVETHAPAIAARLGEAHRATERTLDALVGVAGQLAAATGDARRPVLRQLYLDLAGFTSAYLAHLGDEEQAAMPALTAALSDEELGAVLGKLRGAVPPNDMGTFLRCMLPAMNIHERAEMLGGMKQFAPPPVFEHLRSIAEEVLPPADYRAVATRIGA